MRIANIGAGNVGGGLGAAFAAVGHQVVFGVRDSGSRKTEAALGGAPGARATSPANAVDGADVIAFALRWDAIPATIASTPSLGGRVVIDAMNRLDGDPARSTTQDLADLLPGARFTARGFAGSRAFYGQFLRLGAVLVWCEDALGGERATLWRNGSARIAVPDEVARACLTCLQGEGA